VTQLREQLLPCCGFPSGPQVQRLSAVYGASAYTRSRGVSSWVKSSLEA
jgi:hypothetical protein